MMIFSLLAEEFYKKELSPSFEMPPVNLHPPPTGHSHQLISLLFFGLKRVIPVLADKGAVMGADSTWRKPVFLF
jgi:hypothetical protein